VNGGGYKESFEKSLRALSYIVVLFIVASFLFVAVFYWAGRGSYEGCSGLYARFIRNRGGRVAHRLLAGEEE